jgi:hypothetical protein
MKPSLSLLTSVQIFPLILCINGSAQEPLVRSSVTEQNDLWVGQKITMNVELLVPGYFSGSPAFDLPDPPGMIVIPPTGSSSVGSAKIDGVAYSVQRHAFSVFTRRAGEQTLPAFSVRFSYKRQPLDKDIVAATGKTEPLGFTAKLPPGAEDLGSLICARGLTVKETWQPEPGKAKAGDAFTRTITFTAPDVPAMAFPPFPAGSIDGLGIYPKEPEVLDQQDRGSLTGSRRDTATYVCQRAGQFTLPATSLTWFDLDAKELRSIDFPARTFDVAPNPSLASATPGSATSGVPWKGLAWTAAVSGALAALVFTIELTRLQKMVRRAIAPFRPVHLPPLNPEVTQRFPHHRP